MRWLITNMQENVNQQSEHTMPCSTFGQLEFCIEYVIILQTFRFLAGITFLHNECC